MDAISNELWKNIPGFPGYQASNLGRIKAIAKQSYNAKTGGLCWRKERLLIAKPDSSGYLSHSMKGPFLKKTWLAHRIIALAWIPNPKRKLFVNHKNGIKTDNRVENLEWCTKSKNGIHAVENGLHTALRGEINGNHRLTKADVIEIRNSDGTQKEIANRFGIGRTTVQYIKKRKLWAHI